MTERIIEAVARPARRSASTSTSRCSPATTPSSTACAAATRIDEYLEKVELIRSHDARSASITTDVIVGFCGETDAEFQRHATTCSHDLRFDKVHVAAYSPRPGTIAYRTLADDVPDEVKQERLRALEQLEARVSFEINQQFLDSTQQVLVESRREDRWTGRNRLGKLVHFEGGARVGDMVDVRIERATAWSLQGTALPAPVPA